jgi:hypothetical protein
MTRQTARLLGRPRVSSATQTFCTMRNLGRAHRLFMYRAGVAERPSWPELELLEVCVVLDRLPPGLRCSCTLSGKRGRLRPACSIATRSPPARPERDGAGAPPRERGAPSTARQTHGGRTGPAGAPAASSSYCLLKAECRGRGLGGSVFRMRSQPTSAPEGAVQ